MANERQLFTIECANVDCGERVEIDVSAVATFCKCGVVYSFDPEPARGGPCLCVWDVERLPQESIGAS